MTLASTAASERGIATVRYQTSPAGAAPGPTPAPPPSRPSRCSFDTTAVADGLRDLRAIATDTAGYTRTSATVASRRVDNTLPTVSLADPGAYADRHQDADRHRVRRRQRPRSVSRSTTARPAAAGPPPAPARRRRARARSTRRCSPTARTSCAPARPTPPATSPTRRSPASVDNNAPTGSVPALTPLRGTVDISLNADDGAGSGVASVTGQFRQAGGSTWTDVCTDTTAPYACTGLDTTPYPDGLYEARAIVVDERRASAPRPRSSPCGSTTRRRPRRR